MSRLLAFVLIGEALVKYPSSGTGSLVIASASAAAILSARAALAATCAPARLPLLFFLGFVAGGGMTIGCLLAVASLAVEVGLLLLGRAELVSTGTAGRGGVVPLAGE